MNAILYVDRTAVQWRYLPHQTVYGRPPRGAVRLPATSCPRSAQFDMPRARIWPMTCGNTLARAAEAFL
ncbi:hypothetical protein DEH69_23655 [Streptomyces sp. PT12]|nr:hypothetical protein DEH69_23655 [Streptomyces sp. PT12]